MRLARAPLERIRWAGLMAEGLVGRLAVEKGQATQIQTLQLDVVEAMGQEVLAQIRANRKR